DPRGCGRAGDRPADLRGAPRAPGRCGRRRRRRGPDDGRCAARGVLVRRRFARDPNGFVVILHGRGSVPGRGRGGPDVHGRRGRRGHGGGAGGGHRDVRGRGEAAGRGGGAEGRVPVVLDAGERGRAERQEGEAGARAVPGTDAGCRGRRRV